MNIIKSKAIYFLSRREYAYQELFSKLKKYSEDLGEIKLVLDELKRKGFLSEERYIQSYINSKKNKYGLAKIKYSLKQKTDDMDLINDVLKSSAIDEYEIAKNLWEKKFLGIKARDKTELSRQIRFLQNKGFGFEIINKILKV